MKKYFFTLVAVMIATLSFAQNTLVATLTHGDEISMFYGSGALIEAHSAAVSGDIITLSGGSFYLTQNNKYTPITKAITIRGTGIDANNPTIISDYMYIRIPEEDKNQLIIEGITCSKTFYMEASLESHMTKSAFQAIQISENVTNAQFVNCITQIFNIYGSCSAILSHCYVKLVGNTFGKSTETLFLNCCLDGNIYLLNNSTLVNCILFAGAASNTLPSSCIAMNCIAAYRGDYQSYQFNPFVNMQGTAVDCYVLKGATESAKVFHSGYILTDEAKTTYLGTDGTEIGMYGGQYPYNPTPSYPRITQLNVAKQATADNKLSVDITVSAVE